MFQDRRDAGRKLAARLLQYAHRPEVIVLALPRGGVPVAYEVAQRLGVELDVFLVRKLGVPGHEELAMAAIASDGVRVLNDEVVDRLGISPQAIDAVADRESAELRRREQLYRGRREPIEVRGRTVLLVDDGLATGSTMRAAVRALQRQHPRRIVVAVPVGATETCAEFQREADEVICAVEPAQFLAVGYWYDHFDQTTDEEVQRLLAAAEHSSRIKERRHDSQAQVR